MVNSIIRFSVHNKLIIFLAVISMIVFGIYSITKIPIGAVPDITNNQVQVITVSRNLSTVDVEQFITYPVELEMANLPGVKEIRSISKFGLSVVTIVFEDQIGTYLPRQLISEKIKSAEKQIPAGMGTPILGPISTGLGEIYQYTLETRPGYDSIYSLMDLRTIQDWIVKRQLSGIKGVVEVNTWGGKLKQYEVSIDPEQLKSMHLTLEEVFLALQQNNENTGGSYIEKAEQSYFVRGEGMVKSLDDIQKIVVKNVEGVPVLIRDVGEVRYGHAVRFGAITGNGEGEKVLGQIMMLKDANSNQVINAVKERMASVANSLPEGVYINPVLDRTELIGKTTSTITENLVLGALIVIFVLVFLMGNMRSGLIVASVIPLSLLFGLSMMYVFGVDVNLMSLGAIDFGILVDGAVIIVEFIVFQIVRKQGELNKLTRHELKKAKDDLTIDGSSRMMQSAIFGQVIILIVFIPILSLTSVEGKMFRPLALSFSFILIGAMLLCLTYVPVVAAAFLKPPKDDKPNISDRIMGFLQKLYDPTIRYALKHQGIVLAVAVGLMVLATFTFIKMGGEFIPTLDEGDYVIQPVLKPGTSLSETIEINTQIEQILLDKFPEVEQVVTRIGAAEVPTDPMSMEMSDIIVVLKDRKEWVSAETKEELADKIKQKLAVIPGVGYEFTQPIEMRFNELITGVRADIAIKIYGEDLNLLFDKGNEVKSMITGVEGASDINVEQIVGLPQMSITYRRGQLAQYGLNITDLNDIVRMAFAGMSAGSVFEGEKRFDLVVRLSEKHRSDLESISGLYIALPGGGQIPLKELADIEYNTVPAQISRDDTKRRIVVSVNVRNRDVETLVEEIQEIVDRQLNLPAGYYITYGGQFENLQNAKRRLMFAVPVALLLIFVMLHFTFNSLKQAILVYSAIPLAAIGGVFLLWIRGMPFSISAGVGFIALFGIAVLNGIVLISFFNELKQEGVKDIRQRVLKGTKMRLRPVVLTAATDILGFVPMAFSASAGAEVQRPVATVVIGGLITSTLLTLIVLPVIYFIFDEMEFKPKRAGKKLVAGMMVLLLISTPSIAQDPPVNISLDDAIQIAIQNNAGLKAAELKIDQNEALKKTSFDPGRTMIYYQTEENNTAVENDGVNSIGLQQSLQFPTVYLNQARVNRQNVVLSRYNYDLEQMALKRNVSQTYYYILYHQNRLRLFSYLDSLFARFASAADFRFQAGESNLLEKVTAEAKAQEIRYKLQQVRQDIEFYHTQLKGLMQIQDEFMIADDSLYQLDYELKFNMMTHPGQRFYQSLIERNQAELGVARNQLLPGLYGQYYRQEVNGETGYFGYQVGLNIPVWFFPQAARIQSARIDTEIASQQQQNFQQRITARQNQLQSLRLKFLGALEYYKNQGLQMADDLERVAQRSYQEGETGYLQYIQGLEQSMNIRMSYLESLNQYNQIIIELEYLTIE